MNSSDIYSASDVKFTVFKKTALKYRNAQNLPRQIVTAIQQYINTDQQPEEENPYTQPPHKLHTQFNIEDNAWKNHATSTTETITDIETSEHTNVNKLLKKW